MRPLKKTDRNQSGSASYYRISGRSTFSGADIYYKDLGRKGFRAKSHVQTRKKESFIQWFHYSESGELVVTKSSWFNYENVIQSLREFMETKPCPEGNKYCIVLDNAPWHKKAIRLIWTEQLEEYADIREKMDYLSLPPYSPDLNPIEQVWRKTRREKTHNRFFSAISKLINVLDDYFAQFLCQTINSSRYAVSVALRSNTQVLNSFTIIAIVRQSVVYQLLNCNFSY